MIKIEKLFKSYSKTPLFSDFSLDIEKGKITCILGESGSGKTTLLNIISGLVPFEGEVSKVKCSYVFQKPNLFPSMTVKDNLLIVNPSLEEVLNVAKRFGLEDKLNSYPKHLSGGQAQRVALARGLLYNAELLLLDEPFSNLDVGLKFNLLQEIKDDHAKKNNTVLMVTHDIKEAVFLADRILVLSNGKVVYEENCVNENTEEKIFGIMINLYKS